MKKASDTTRAQYDFSGGERGRYAKRYAQGSNMVLLAPDVAKSFPDSDSVNAALRLELKAAKKGATRKSGRAAPLLKSGTSR